MFVINRLDGRPGEAELLAVAAAYFADRLLSDHQRKQLAITVNITTQPIRVPIPREMLVTRYRLFRPIPPCDFAFSVSLARGVRNALEVIAHELIHVAQVVHGRLIITRREVQIGFSGRTIHLVRWGRSKAIPVEQSEWQERPWEIEACRWQICLVDEFLASSSGQHLMPIVRRPNPNRLALYDISGGLTRPPPVPAVSALRRLSAIPNPDRTLMPVETKDKPLPALKAPSLPLLPAAHIKVMVPGLSEMRNLSIAALGNKHQELRDRGLAH